MASKVEIWNLALTRIGGSLVIDENENSIEAQLCKVHYPFALDFVLESADWNFAIERAEIAESANVAPVYRYEASFLKPADCLRIIEVWDNKRIPNNGRFEHNNLDWEEEGQYISADTKDQVYIRYIRKVEDANRFTSSFTQTLATYLAHVLAIPIAQNRALKADLLTEYAVTLDEAMANDGLTGRTKALRSNVIMGARTQ